MKDRPVIVYTFQRLREVWWGDICVLCQAWANHKLMFVSKAYVCCFLLCYWLQYHLLPDPSGSNSDIWTVFMSTGTCQQNPMVSLPDTPSSTRQVRQPNIWNTQIPLRCTGYTSKAWCKTWIIKEEVVHLSKSAEGFCMTLRSTSQKHIIVHFYMHSKTKIPLKYVLERAMNSCEGTCGGDKVLNSPDTCTLPGSRVLLKHWNFHSLHSECDQGRGAASRGVPSEHNEFLNPAIRPLHSLQILRGGTDWDWDRGMAYGGVTPLHHWK